MYQPGKALWDWLQLLIIPAVLAVGGYLFNYTTSRNEQAITSDNQCEAAMKEYFDKMSELMLHENLSESDSDAKVRKIARVWTLSVLRRLDKDRKANVLKFLYESGLIDKDKKIIDLSEADLSEAYLFSAALSVSDLSGAKLHKADLFSADLGGANLIRADLSEANLNGANLYLANLSGADLSGALLSEAFLGEAFLGEADLSYANLTGAKVTDEQLGKAKSLEGTTMPDGSQHP